MTTDPVIQEYLRELTTVTDRARAEIDAASNTGDLEMLRIKYLGKRGSVTRFLRALGDLPAQERRHAGCMANDAKELLEDLLNRRKRYLQEEEFNQRLQAERH